MLEEGEHSDGLWALKVAAHGNGLTHEFSWVWQVLALHFSEWFGTGKCPRQLGSRACPSPSTNCCPGHTCEEMQFPSSLPCCFLTKNLFAIHEPTPAAQSSASPCMQGVLLFKVFYLIPTTHALCQKNTTVLNVCEDVNACPKPPKYRCAMATESLLLIPRSEKASLLSLWQRASF